jgi:hypothetical protein
MPPYSPCGSEHLFQFPKGIDTTSLILKKLQVLKVGSRLSGVSEQKTLKNIY